MIFILKGVTVQAPSHHDWQDIAWSTWQSWLEWEEDFWKKDSWTSEIYHKSPMFTSMVLGLTGLGLRLSFLLNNRELVDPERPRLALCFELTLALCSDYSRVMITATKNTWTEEHCKLEMPWETWAVVLMDDSEILIGQQIKWNSTAF